MPDVITSRSNPLVQRCRRLGERRHRKREGVFLVTGGQPVWRAVESGWRIDTLIACDDLIGHEASRQMVADAIAAGCRVQHVSPEVFDAIADRDGITGVAAIVEQRTAALDELTTTPTSITVVLHSIGNPGNLGTIIRTADAVEAAGVVLVGDTTDPWSLAAVRASMGSVFAVPVVFERDIAPVVAWARDRDVQLWATSGYASRELWEVPVSGPIAVVMGSEGDGLPREVLDAADERVRIPMGGTAESLNLAVATGITLYDIRRRSERS